MKHVYITESEFLKLTVKKYYEKLYTHKFENLD